MVRNFAGLLAVVICCFLFVSAADAKAKRPKQTAATRQQKPEQKPANKITEQRTVALPKPIVILDPKAGNSSGVSIATAPWYQEADGPASDKKVANHVDETYYAFAKAHKDPLSRYDFYYRLEIVPQFRESFNVCTNKVGFTQFFDNLFKSNNGALIAIKANIQHRWSSGSATDLFKGDAVLVIAAKGDDSTGKPGAGCFFDFTTRPSFPWIQWNGGRADHAQDAFDDFQIKFNVTGGQAKSSDLVNAVVGLFTSASAAARWFTVASPLASPVFGAAEALGNSFEAALQKAGTLQNQVSKVYYLNAFFPDGDAQHGRILVKIPDLFKGEDGSLDDSGSLAIYVRRQASIALQGSGDITPDVIFNTSELAYRQCPMGKIASGTCDVADNVTLRIALLKALAKIDARLVADNPIAPLFNLKEPAPPKANAGGVSGAPGGATPGVSPVVTPGATPTPSSGAASSADAKPDKDAGKAADKKDEATPDTNPDRRKLVYDICKGMRAVSILQLHLSTLDEIAVRWAFTKEGGVQDALAEATKGSQVDKDKFKTNFGHSLEEIAQQCWNDGDELLLTQTAKGLNRHLEGTQVEAQVKDNRPKSENEHVVIQAEAVAPMAAVTAAKETTFVLDQSQRTKFNKGTFGFDLSHYEIDVSDTLPAKCKDQKVYNSDPQCSCSVNWKGLAQKGLRFVYYEQTVGAKPADASATKVWAELESFHTSKQLFRGAYHFLEPNTSDVSASDATKQAENFLQSINAVNGNKPAQLAPVLDMEGTKTPVKVDSEEFKQCKKGYLRKDDSTPPNFSCDMWYKVKPEDIAALAKDWIGRVEKATGKTVIIYTNKDDWWDFVMKPSGAGEDIIKSHPIWIARYANAGPQHNPDWGGSGVKWGMPPLPADATYPSNFYSVPHFWQFTEDGKIQFGADGSSFVGNGITCNGTPSSRTIDLNYVPVAGTDFDKLFSTPDEVVAAASKAAPGGREHK